MRLFYWLPLASIEFYLKLLTPSLIFWLRSSSLLSSSIVLCLLLSYFSEIFSFYFVFCFCIFSFSVTVFIFFIFKSKCSSFDFCYFSWEWFAFFYLEICELSRSFSYLTSSFLSISCLR